METNTQDQINRLEIKVDEIYKSVEKTRKYFLIIMWVTIAMVVIPVIGLFFAIPSFINTYSNLF